jgi:hypothetical protein
MPDWEEDIAPPNNSLKLTWRAALWGPLAWPASRGDNPASLARFRRAA